MAEIAVALQWIKHYVAASGESIYLLPFVRKVPDRHYPLTAIPPSSPTQQMLNDKHCLMFSFRETCHRQMGQDNKGSYPDKVMKNNMDSEATKSIHLVLTTARLSRLQYETSAFIKRQTAMRRTVFYSTRRNMSASTLVIVEWSLATKSSILVGGIACASSFKCRHRKKSNGVRSGDREGQAMIPPHSFHLPGYVASNYSRKFSRVVGLRRAGTITLVAQVGAYLQAAPQPAWQQVRAHEDVPQDTSTQVYAKADLISTHKRIIPRPEVTTVDAKEALMRKTRFVGPKNLFAQRIDSVLLTHPFAEMHS
jgi:hypothetical protein